MNTHITSNCKIIADDRNDDSKVNVVNYMARKQANTPTVPSQDNLTCLDQFVKCYRKKAEDVNPKADTPPAGESTPTSPATDSPPAIESNSCSLTDQFFEWVRAGKHDHPYHFEYCYSKKKKADDSTPEADTPITTESTPISPATDSLPPVIENNTISPTTDVLPTVTDEVPGTVSNATDFEFIDISGIDLSTVDFTNIPFFFVKRYLPPFRWEGNPIFDFSNCFRDEFYFSYLDSVVYTIITLLPLLIAIAFFTLAERKAMASIQRRKGPNIVGLCGFLQPFADGLKLVVKEIIIPNKSNKFLFIFGSSLTLFLSFIGWAIIPYNPFNNLLDLNVSLILMLVISSLSVYGIIIAGWSSNSKYALLGALRSVAQMLSYEVSISLILIPVILLAGSLSLSKIVYSQMITVWFIFPLFPLGIIFFISILAETNRLPFDLPEAEAELVAGYNVEYSAFAFAAFFLGEYSNILIMSALFIVLFFGGGSFFSLSLFQSTFLTTVLHDFVFGFKISVIVFMFVFIRANLPRFRFDQLMFIGWKIFLPLTLSFIFFYPCLFFFLGALDITQIPRLGIEFNYIFSMSTRF